MIFHALDSNLVATVLNMVVLTAALSVYNSCVYCNSRMLFGLAKQGNGPRNLLKTNKSGVPVVAISVSAAATLLCVLINYLMPGKAFELLMALVVSALVINWAMISLAHLKFRKSKQAEGVVPKFKAFWYPFGNYLCLAFMAGILVIMYLTPGIQISVLLIPVWIIVLAIGYQFKQKRRARVAANLG
jgi:aromatic amino acid transport protein AroP